MSDAHFCSGDCVMVGKVNLVVQILSRHLSVSFHLTVHESQAELDCQCEFPYDKLLTKL